MRVVRVALLDDLLALVEKQKALLRRQQGREQDRIVLHRLQQLDDVHLAVEHLVGALDQPVALVVPFAALQEPAGEDLVCRDLETLAAHDGVDHAEDVLLREPAAWHAFEHGQQRIVDSFEFVGARPDRVTLHRWLAFTILTGDESDRFQIPKTRAVLLAFKHIAASVRVGLIAELAGRDRY